MAGGCVPVPLDPLQTLFQVRTLRQRKTEQLAWSWGDGGFVSLGVSSIALETPKNK